MKFCPECGSSLTSKQVDDQQRTYCPQPDCDFTLWDNPVPVVAAIVNYQDKILLAQNSAWPAGRYSFITGYLERLEHPEAAILREVKEELGLDAELDKFVGHFMFKENNQLLLVYSVVAQGTIELNHELNDYKLFSIDELPDYLFSYPEFSQAVILKYLNPLT